MSCQFKTNPRETKKRDTFLMVFQEFPVKNTLTSINLEIIYLNASKKWMLLIY